MTVPDVTSSWTTHKTAVTAQSSGALQGAVTFNTSCCFDVVRQRTVVLRPAPVSGFTPLGATLPANGTTSTQLSLFVPIAPSQSEPDFPYGKFLVTVEGKHVASGATASTQVGLKRLPASESAPACRPSPYVFSSGTILDALILTKEAAPSATPTTIGIYSPKTSDKVAIRLDIADAPSTPASSAIITVSNPSSTRWRITSAGCSAPGLAKTLTVQSGGTGTMTIAQGVDHTLIVQEEACVWFIWCVTKQWEDWGVFTQPAFWAAFGGKASTFTVIDSR